MVHIPEHNLSINKAERIFNTSSDSLSMWQFEKAGKRRHLQQRFCTDWPNIYTGSRLNHGFTIWNRLVDFRFLFCIFLQTYIPDQVMKFTSNQKSCIAQRASPSDVQGLAWSSTGVADNDWEPFWQRVTSLLCRGHFCKDEGFWTHDEKAKCMESGAALPRLLLVDCWKGRGE